MKITPQSMFQIETLSQPVALSKSQVFYLKTNISEEANDYKSSLFLYDANTDQQTPYGTGSDQISQVKLSPDRQMLSFVAKTEDKMQLFIQPVAGGQAVQKTFEEKGIGEYHWSSDGQMIYFLTYEPADNDRESDNDQKVPKKTVATKVMHKMDGASFIDETVRTYFKCLILDSDAVEVIYESDEKFRVAHIVEDQKAFIIAATDFENDWVWGSAIYELDFKSKSLKPFSHDLLENGQFYDLVPNPSGDQFLLIGNDFSKAFVTLDHIYLYDLSSKTLKNITDNLDFGIGDSIVDDTQQNLNGANIVQWTDDEHFVFLVTKHAHTALYRGNINGELEEIIDKPLRLTGMTNLLDSALDELWVTYSTFTTPSKLAKIDKSGNLKDFFNPNEKFEDEHNIVDPERFWVKTAENVQIQGWYLAPVGEKENHPAILNIHGGPQVNFGETFFTEMQIMASAGYGVIMLNPRGGSGYGQEFVASILGDYGNVDYHDLMTGLDDVLERHPEIDRDKIYVTGGSYGGFMTNWIVTHTDRFKAAATQRSISNWVSFYGTSDIGPHFVKYQLEEDLSNVERLWELSPLAHAQNLKTPLLVLHAQEDHRCPLEQGEQMYRAALVQNVDTRLVTFPQSSHGLSREGLPNLRIERLNELLSWFDKHY